MKPPDETRNGGPKTAARMKPAKVPDVSVTLSNNCGSGRGSISPATRPAATIPTFGAQRCSKRLLSDCWRRGGREQDRTAYAHQQGAP